MNTYTLTEIELQELDTILAGFEDWMHGKDGDKISHARKILSGAKKEDIQPVLPSQLIPLPTTWLPKFKEGWYRDNTSLPKKERDEAWKETERVCHMIYKYQVEEKRRQGEYIQPVPSIENYGVSDNATSGDIGDAPFKVQNNVEQGGYYWPLWKFFNDEHNLILLDSDIQEIVHQVERFKKEAE